MSNSDFLKYEINNEDNNIKKQFIRNMFDAIAPTYDLLNHLLSFGIDIFWRKHIFKYIPELKRVWTIDLCCGTGDLSFLLYKRGAKLVSLDFSLNMLKKGREKLSLLGYNIAADVGLLPFTGNTFSIATIAFGIRNLPDIDNCIHDVNRILIMGGKFVILEFIRPVSKFIKIFYTFYLKLILPFIGGIISGNMTAYKYLSKTIETFIEPSELKIILENNGFKQINYQLLTFGVAAIIITQKVGVPE